MPDYIRTPFDRFQEESQARPASVPSAISEMIALPARGWEATSRGLRGRCPRCGEARLFHRFLKPIPRCPHCGQNWTFQQADDFPAYVSIIVTGHLMAPIIIALVKLTELPFWLLTGTIVGLALALMLITLQPAKGAIIAVQWWFGLHGFEKERPEPAEFHQDES